MLEIEHEFAMLAFLLLNYAEAIELFVVKGGEAEPLFSGAVHCCWILCNLVLGTRSVGVRFVFSSTSP